MTLDNNLLKKIENFKRHILKSIPLPSTNTPSTDNTNGSTGSSLDYARSDHQHPKSTLYAESVHSHNDILSDLLDDINNTTIVVDSPNPIGQDGDTILLRGRMYGDDVSGKSIDYYIGNTLIGSSVTNGNGVSFLDYECDGLGVRNVTAKKSSIVSETYSIIDAVFCDRGTSTDYGTWITEFTQITRGDDYTTLTPSDNFDAQYKAISLSDFVIEGDVNLTYSANINFMRFSKNTWTSITVFSAQYDFVLTSGQWSHFKLVKQGNSVDVFIDGVKKITKEVNDTVDTFMMLLDNTKTTDLKYKNFVIYPI